MYDIIRLKGISPEPFLFSKFYFLDEVKNKIIEVRDLNEAIKHKNRKQVLLLNEYTEDIGLMRQFAEKNQAAFLIDLSRIIKTSSFKRAVEISKLMRFLRVCIKYEVPFVFASFAENEFSIRTSRELCHIATLLGLNIGQAKFGLERMNEYLE